MLIVIHLQVNKLSKIFLFDVDGTLSVNGIIPTSAIKILKQLREAGNKVLLCTGRCLGQLNDILNKIEIDGAILNNGAYAYVDNLVIYDNPIPTDLILSLAQKGLCLGILSKDCYGIINFDAEVMAAFIKHFELAMPERLSLDYVKNNPIYSLGIYTFDSLVDTINDYQDLNFIKVCDVGYDIVKKGVSKASPIASLKTIYPDHEIIAFGDNYNDIEMLKASDVAIVMPTSPKKVKEIADYITTDVLADGIANAIKFYLKL